MSGYFRGRCFRCGAVGHRSVNCANNRVDGAESAGDAIHRQPHAYQRQSPASVMNEPHVQQAGGFGRGANEPPAVYTQQQQHRTHSHSLQQPEQQHEERRMPGRVGELSAADVGRLQFQVVHNATPANLPAALEEFIRETGDENPYVYFGDARSISEMQNYLENPYRERSRGLANNENQSLETCRERVNRSQPVDVSPTPVMGRYGTSGQISRETQYPVQAPSLQRSRERVNSSQPAGTMPIPATGMNYSSRQNTRTTQDRVTERVDASQPVDRTSVPVFETSDASGQTTREMQGHFAPLSAQNERERMRRCRHVDISTIPVMDLSDAARPAQPPQRQAGRGALPGARNSQLNRAGFGLLGRPRVERLDAARGQGRQQRQRSGRGSREGWPAKLEEVETPGVIPSVAGPGLTTDDSRRHTVVKREDEQHQDTTTSAADPRSRSQNASRDAVVKREETSSDEGSGPNPAGGYARGGADKSSGDN